MADDGKEVHSYGPQFATHLHYDKPPDGEIREVPAQESNQITFKHQRRVHPRFWFIVSCVCLLSFLLALLCFYQAPSKRRLRLETYIILNEIYYESYQDAPNVKEPSPEYQKMEENIINSYQTALEGINYDRVQLHKDNHRPPTSPLRSDPLGVLAVVDVFVTITATPVEAHKEIRDRKERILGALTDNLQPTILGSLGILAVWIQAKNPLVHVELQCPEELVIPTDIGRATATIDLPTAAMPVVLNIDDEKHHVHRLPLPDTPTDVFPMGSTEIQYRVILVDIDNGGAMDECSFDVSVQDTESPVLLCPYPSDVTINGSKATWNEPVVFDNVSNNFTIIVESNHESGSSFNAGDTVVVYHARDEAGNTANCAFVVTVN